MAQRRFLLLHGVEHHKPPGHWLYQLARALRDAGESVSYPQLPDADEPSLEHWRATLARELDALDVPDDEDAEAESVVVCHSLGCLLWLHHCARPAAHRRVDRVLLVAPPSPEILWPAVAAFRLPSDLDAVAVTAAARAGTRVVAGADDPYCPGGAQTVFAAPLRLDADVIAGGGHLSEADGYGPWPSMTRWCFDAAVRLRGNDVDPGAAGAGELDGKAGTGGGRLRNRGGLVSPASAGGPRRPGRRLAVRAGSPTRRRTATRSRPRETASRKARPTNAGGALRERATGPARARRPQGFAAPWRASAAARPHVPRVSRRSSRRGPRRMRRQRARGAPRRARGSSCRPGHPGRTRVRRRRAPRSSGPGGRPRPRGRAGRRRAPAPAPPRG